MTSAREQPGLDAAIADEQHQVDTMYGRLDELRNLTDRQLTDVRAMGASGTPAARSERDAFATEYERRLIQLRGLQHQALRLRFMCGHIPSLKW